MRDNHKTERGAAAAELVKRIEREQTTHALTDAELDLIPAVTLRRLVKEGRVTTPRLSVPQEQRPTGYKLH
jgi:hypothetical protein